VEIKWPPATQGSAARSKRCPDCPPGHVTLMKFTDEAEARSSVEVFRATHTENPLAGNTDLQVDSAGQGAMQTQVTFYDDMGAEMGSEVLSPASVISYLPDAPNAPDIWSFGSGRYVLRAGVPLRFDTSLGSYMDVDHAEFRPVNPAAPRAASMMEITSNDPSGFVIHDVTATPVAIGDIDRDGDVDLVDLHLLTDCMTGPNNSTPPPACDALHFDASDLDSDVDVDIKDFDVYQRIPL
jgi:hypothetical protein